MAIYISETARQAYDLYADYCGGNPPPRVPGMDTIIRLQARVDAGASHEKAAAREYLYRWSLACQMDAPGIASCGDSWRGARVFGAPHLIGQ